MIRIVLVVLFATISYSSSNLSHSSLNEMRFSQAINSTIGFNNSSTVPCRNDTDCNFGICNSSYYKCQCNKGFVNTENNKLIIPCYYEQKLQYNAFILELIIGFGAGQFYVGRVVHGFLKLIAYLIGIVSICLFPLSLKKFHSRSSPVLTAFFISFFYCSIAICFSTWYIYDLVVISNGRELDGNGFPLSEWVS